RTVPTTLTATRAALQMGISRQDKKPRLRVDIASLAQLASLLMQLLNLLGEFWRVLLGGGHGDAPKWPIRCGANNGRLRAQLADRHRQIAAGHWLPYVKRGLFA